jgi:pimeloyl-ACP methyl ester carboxylesterase
MSKDKLATAISAIRIFPMIALVCLTLILGACGGGNNDAPGPRTVEKSYLSAYQDYIVWRDSNLRDMEYSAYETDASGAPIPGADDGLRFKTYFEDLVQVHLNERAGGILKLFPVSYDSRDADGKTVKLSGGIFVPQILWGKKLPIMIMLHGTETNKGNVPYYNKGEDTPIAWVAAAMGFIVLMPDYPGMGLDSAPYHPYCHGKSLAYSAVDMLTFWKGKLPDGFEWDGRLVVMGYSEGGYATIATVREIETNAAKYPGISVTCSVPMAGPYDMSVTERKQMNDPTNEVHYPVFLPYVLLGYDQVYNRVNKNAVPELHPANAIRAELINGGLLDVMAGGKTVNEIDYWLLFQFSDPNLKITGKEYVIPYKMLQKSWVDAQISDTAYSGNSKVVQILKENDIKTDWGVKSPMLLVHSDADDAVPYENSKIVMANFSSKPTFITIPKLGHWNAAYVANPIALGWIAKKLNID